jgi:glycosyltransferase involved in cell wall biosynthesis
MTEMQRFLTHRTDLPIFPITYHFSDDAWGKASIAREPGRILCLPRKGGEFIERLEREFSGIVRVDAVSQARMAVEYARADIYVHTGFPEGQPMPVTEAMISGCLVCGFTGQGGFDVMQDGRTAYVADDGNAEQLVSALRRALHDPARETVRAAAQAIGQAFLRERAEEQLLACYRDWLPTLPKRSARMLDRISAQWHRWREDDRPSALRRTWRRLTRKS